MPGPHAFAVRNNAARLARLSRSLTSCLALRPHAHTTPPRPPHPTPTFVTIREAPLLARRDGASRSHISEKQKQKIFHEGLDSPNQLEPAHEIRSCAHAISQAIERSEAPMAHQNLPDGRISRPICGRYHRRDQVIDSDQASRCSTFRDVRSRDIVYRFTEKARAAATLIHIPCTSERHFAL